MFCFFFLLLQKLLFSHSTTFLPLGVWGCPARLRLCNVGQAVSLAWGECCEQGMQSQAGICALWIHGGTGCTAGMGGRRSTIVCQGIMSAQCESQLETWHNRIAVCTRTWCGEPWGQPALPSACLASGVVSTYAGSCMVFNRKDG